MPLSLRNHPALTDVVEYHPENLPLRSLLRTFLFPFRILNLCLQFEISEEDVDKVELGIRKWAVDYERCVRSFRFRRNEGQLNPCIQPLLPAQA